MKKIISLITIFAVIMTMFTVIPASAQVYIRVTSGHSTATGNGGLYGKEATDYAAVMNTGEDTKAVVNIGGATTPYKFSDSKYAVIDLNVAPTDAANYLSAGPNAGIFCVNSIKAFSKNRWNHIRLFVENKTEEELTASGKYQPMTMYVNGQLVANAVATALNEGDVLAGGQKKYGQSLRFSVHGTEKNKNMAYVADISFSESDTTAAPVMPAIPENSKYDIYPDGIVLKEDITVGEVVSDAYTVKVYNGDTQITDASAKIENGYTIIIIDNANKLYSYYDVEYNPTADEWKDDDGNTYTWYYSNITKTLTLGMVDNPVIAEGTTYGVIDTETWANGSSDGPSARPWHQYRNQIKDIKFVEIKNHHFLGLGREMFAGFTAIETVVIPRYVKDGQWGSFGYCTNLKKVIFEEGSHGMEGSGVKDKPYYPNDIRGMKMFQGCSSLTTVDLGTAFTKLNGGQFFYKCTSLKEIFIPAALTDINASTFDKCSDIKLITYENSVAAAKLSTVTFTGVSNITTELIPAQGYICDVQGNENSIKWKIDSNTLTISDVSDVGTGDMPDKASDNYQGLFPWNHITGFNKIIVEDGITRIGRWFATSLTAGKQELISLPSTLRAASVFSFVSVKCKDFVFNEGAKDLFATAQVINRDAYIENLYLPSTAKNISIDLWRALDNSSSDIYVGTPTVNIYAPLGSDAYKWASHREANPAQDLGKSNGINVVINAFANITVDSFNDENVIVANNGFSAQSADIVVAYFDGDTFMNAVYVKEARFDSDSTVTVPAPKSADGYTREVFVWNDTSNLTPVAINKAE